jgi:hypothetical protein
MGYEIRHGRRIEFEVLDGPNIPTPKREKKAKPFKAEWVKYPARWAEILRQATRVSTHQLAFVVLAENFEREHSRWGEEIVLSSVTTRMARNSRMRAIRELVKLGLISVEQYGREAVRISNIYHLDKRRKEKNRE